MIEIRTIILATLFSLPALAGAQALLNHTNVTVDPNNPFDFSAYYPKESNAANEGGRCEVRVHVSKTGTISGAEVIKSTGFPRLDNACKLALNGHRVLPATTNGEAVETDITMPLTWYPNSGQSTPVSTSTAPQTDPVAPVTSNIPGRLIIHGTPHDCKDITALDNALSISISSGGKSRQFFNDWSQSDFDAAIEWANECSRYGNRNIAPSRKIMVQEEKLRSEQAAQERYVEERARQFTIAEQARGRAIRAENEEKNNQRVAERQAEEAKDEAAEAAAERCEKSGDYALYESEKNIVMNLQRKAAAQRSLKREEKIEEVSGTENLSNKYSDGQTIVTADENLAEEWQKYKANGGKSTSLTQVTVTTHKRCR